jgi:hypothetical protein
MRIMPPAIPRIPEMKDVTTAETARIEYRRTGPIVPAIIRHGAANASGG